MKLTAFLLLLGCLQVSAKGSAQTITLAEKNAPLDRVFRQIERQTSYVFFYDDHILDNTKKIDVNLKNATIEQVLQVCLKGTPLGYQIVGNTIIVVMKQKQKALADAVQGGSKGLPIDVRGRVTNENGDPIAGVTVTVKGSRQATSTNKDGEFVLPQTDDKSILVFSGANVETSSVNIAGKSDLSVKLNTKINKLDEVQVIAYGTITKRLNTGNVSTVKAEDIERQPINNPLLALQGRVPGMFISQSTGLPGAGIKIQIRGLNNLGTTSIPLYIIDGVPYTSDQSSSFISNNAYFLGRSNEGASNPLSYINPADIQSIEVLKDADATAIYGSRGANGVILITTKKGKVGPTKVDINMQNGFGQVARKMKVMNTRQYLDMRYEAFKNDKAIPNTIDYDLTLWDTTRNTDWQKELIGGKSHYSDVQIAFSGGNINTQFLIGVGYHRETTVFPGDFNDSKVSLHFNVSNLSTNRKFKISLSGLYLLDNNRLLFGDLTEVAMQLHRDATPGHNLDGTLNWAPNILGASTWPYSNPFASLRNKFNLKTSNLVSDGTISYEIFPGLEVKGGFGFTSTQSNSIQTVPLASHDPSTWATTQRSSRFVNSSIQSWILEPQVTYKKKISKGLLTVLVGSTVLQTTSGGQSLGAEGFNSDQLMEDISSATIVSVLASSNVIYKYNALFSRLNYNWDDKYLLNLTARRDGSSRFGPANQFHNFEAFGAGWIFSKEKLIQQAIPILSYGKLRGSYGTTGSDQVGDYTFMDLYSSLTGIGVPYQGTNSIAPTRLFTPDLAWQETKKLEAGIELGFLNDRFIINASYYRNRSSNQLLGYALPGITGFTSIQKNLDALVQNKGWELEFKTVNLIARDFRWTTFFNISANQNKLLSAPKGLSASYQRLVGNYLQSKIVYHFSGVDPITGLFQVADSHGNATTNPNPVTDATVLINVAPQYFGGFQNTLSYKNLELDFLFQFVKQKGTIYLDNVPAGYFSSVSGSNQPTTVLNHWRKPGDVSNYQRYSQNANILASWQNARASDLIYGDASYIRLKNLSLSCLLPEKWISKVHLKKTRIYMQGQNLLMITNYQGLDPETGSSITLPPLRVITIGLQVGL